MRVIHAHAGQLVSVLDRVGDAVAVCFPGYTVQHPVNFRKVSKLLAGSFPEGCGAFECVCDLPAQRWFILRATDLQAVEAGVTAILNRTGLIRFARIYVSGQPRLLVATWPTPGECIDFFDVSLDLQPHAGIAASPPPATDVEPRPATAGNIATNPFARLCHSLMLRLATVNPYLKRLEFLFPRWNPRPKSGPNIHHT